MPFLTKLSKNSPSSIGGGMNYIIKSRFLPKLLMKKTIFELSTEDKKELDMILKNLQEFCMLHRIPMFVSVAIANKENETAYNNVVYNSKSHNIYLHDDKFAKYMLIANGFEAVAPRDTLSYDPSHFISDMLEE